MITAPAFGQQHHLESRVVAVGKVRQDGTSAHQEWVGGGLRKHGGETFVVLWNVLWY